MLYTAYLLKKHFYTLIKTCLYQSIVESGVLYTDNRIIYYVNLLEGLCIHFNSILHLPNLSINVQKMCMKIHIANLYVRTSKSCSNLENV